MPLPIFTPGFRLTDGDKLNNLAYNIAAQPNLAEFTVLNDDFLGALINPNWRLSKGSDGAAVNFVNTTAVNGIARGVMGAGAGATMAANGVQLDSGMLSWFPNQGGLSIEAKIKFSAITNVAVFFGLTDQVSALEMPWTISGTTYTSNQTDGLGFLFDTGATTVSIRAVGVANDVDGAAFDTGLAFAADTYRVLKIVVSKAGRATFFINNSGVGAINLASTPTVGLTPVLAGFARAAASRNLDIDYIKVQQNRVP